jgi:hypothetical protein
VLRRVLSSPRLVVTAAALLIGQLASGCLSNEYVIPSDELARVVQLPPQTRGQEVRVVQQVGNRRAAAGPQDWPTEEGPPPPDTYLDMHLDVPVGGGGHPRPAPAGVRPLPARPRGDTSLWRGGSGGGGGGGKDDLVVVALVLLAVAAVSMVALGATEGARYDGRTAVAPGQPVHLESDFAPERVVPLAALTPADLTGVRRALVMDDEGYGLPRTGRAPLDRRGFAFKLDLGTLAARVGAADEAVSGLTANIQVGGFPWQRVGIMGSLSLGGGTDSLGRTFVRDGVGVELQTFPVHLGRLHAGPFAHAGAQLGAEPDQDAVSGPAVGGGVLLELDLTTRLALYGRGDVTAARLERDGWRSTAAVTVGMAVY